MPTILHSPTPEPTQTKSPSSPEPTHAPTPVPTEHVDCSAVACEVLGWTNAESYGSPTVCGASAVGGEEGACSGELVR